MSRPTASKPSVRTTAAKSATGSTSRSATTRCSSPSWTSSSTARNSARPTVSSTSAAAAVATTTDHRAGCCTGHRHRDRPVGADAHPRAHRRACRRPRQHPDPASRRTDPLLRRQRVRRGHLPIRDHVLRRPRRRVHQQSLRRTRPGARLASVCRQPLTANDVITRARRRPRPARTPAREGRTGHARHVRVRRPRPAATCPRSRRLARHPCQRHAHLDLRRRIAERSTTPSRSSALARWAAPCSPVSTQTPKPTRSSQSAPRSSRHHDGNGVRRQCCGVARRRGRIITQVEKPSLRVLTRGVASPDWLQILVRLRTCQMSRRFTPTSKQDTPFHRAE